MRTPLLLVAFAALAASFGCTQSEDDACAKDEVYESGACRPKPAGTSGSGGDAGSPTEPPEGGAPSLGGSSSEGGSGAAPADVAFGATCDTHADCGGSTDYCAKGPAAPPYCTAKDCDGNEDICPEGWECFDVSIFAPGEPWICNQP